VDRRAKPNPPPDKDTPTPPSRAPQPKPASDTPPGGKRKNRWAEVGWGK
jgi:hypothetical protein